MIVVHIKLTRDQINEAAIVGITRRINHIFAGDRDRWGARPEDSWQRHVEGALMERTLAEYIGTHWDGGVIGVYDEKDVADFFQVRGTSHSSGRLILHPDDPQDDVFILITGILGKYTLRGWCYAREGQIEKWWADPSRQGRWAYFVPAHALNPMDTLPMPERKSA